jgi:exopolysaccharide production protein ExoZ
MNLRVVDSPRNLPGIQYIRGIAALLVVIYHLTFQLAQFTSLEEVTNLRSGVDMFFVVSGFVMVYSTGGGTRTSASKFIKNRFIRIVPLYYLLTLVLICILLVLPSLAKSVKLDFWHALFSFLFIAWPSPVGGILSPIIVQGWTLNLELLFYAFFSLGIKFGSRSQARILTIAALPLVVFSSINLMFDLDGIINFYTNPILLEFVYGMLIAVMFKKWESPNASRIYLLSVPTIALMLLLPAEDPQFRFLNYGIPSAFLVVFLTFRAVPTSKVLHVLGDMSYSLYLIHFFTNSAFAQIWRKFIHIPMNAAGITIFLVMGTLAGLAAAYLCWRFVEKPLTRATRQLLNGQAKPGKADIVKT